MPKKLPQSRVAAADRIATLLRIYRAAVRAGDQSLRDASASELRTKYRIEIGDLTDDPSPEKNGGGE